MSTDSLIITQLIDALRKNESRALETAIKTFLHLETPNPTSTSLFPEPLCEGVEAKDCANLLEKCISGDDKKSAECRDKLQELSRTLTQGSLKNVNNVMARNVCRTLGINYNSSNPVNEWLAELEKKDKDATKNIKENGSLMHIIRTFVDSAKNLKPNNSRRNISTLPTFSFKQAGGGILENDTFWQYSDTIKTLVSMRGGGQPILNKTYEEIVLMYNRFVESLKRNGKQIDNADDEHIRQLLGQIKSNETKLTKIVTYIDAFNKLKNDPRLTDEDKQLLNNSTVTVDLLEQLNKKYEEYSKKRQTTVTICMNMFGTLHQATKHRASSEREYQVDTALLNIRPSTQVPTNSSFLVGTAPTAPTANKYFSW